MSAIDPSPGGSTRIVDLSMPVDDATPFYPGDPEPSICLASTISEHGVNVSQVNIGSHTGTHCDAPYHFLEDGMRIDQLPLERFYGPAAILDVDGLEPHEPIGWERLRHREADLSEVGIVFLRTGWSKHLGSEEFYAHPALSGEACAELLARGIRTIGIDAINIDLTPTGEVDRADFVCHQLISELDGVIVENLVNLAAVRSPRPLVSVLPLRLTGADGAPTRAVALEPA